jgi:hypothetical protein
MTSSDFLDASATAIKRRPRHRQDARLLGKQRFGEPAGW